MYIFDSDSKEGKSDFHPFEDDGDFLQLKPNYLANYKEKTFQPLEQSNQELNQLKQDLAYQKNNVPQETTGILGWIAGGLNKITFNFFDWVSGGYIPSFSTQKIQFDEQFDNYLINLENLKEKIEHTELDLSQTYFDTKADLKKIKVSVQDNIKRNSQYLESMVWNEMNQVDRKQTMPRFRISSAFHDDDLNGKAFNGNFDPDNMRMINIHSQQSSNDDELPSQRIYQFFADDRATLTALVGSSSHPLMDKEKAQAYFADVFNKVNKDHANLHENYKQLSGYSKDLFKTLKIFKPALTVGQN